MTGGISALKGFDYQATVTLDRILDHFASHGASARVRPEGLDDLDLIWTDAGVARRLYAQVKKPQEDRLGNRKPKAWSIGAAVAELMPGTLARLAGNDHTQVWILGDALDRDLGNVVSARGQAPWLQPQAYWRLAHAIARRETFATAAKGARGALGKWRPSGALPSDPAAACAKLEAEFAVALAGKGLGHLVPSYAAELKAAHVQLPSLLDRLTVEPAYGSETDVQARVTQRLQAEFSLSAALVEQTLFRNFRGFIQDISKQHDRSFDRAELELEVRSVWPHMSPVRQPPIRPADHVARPDLVDTLVADGAIVEVTGVSGIGKSTLAAEVANFVQDREPSARVLYVEVRPETTLRDVLAGAAFHLRRFGHDQPFAAAVDMHSATDTVIERTVRRLAVLPEPVWLLIDLVEGQAGATFAAELTGLTRLGALTGIRILIFAHERVISGLSILEQGTLGVRHIDVPGLDFEEFAKLAAGHGHLDRVTLHRVHALLSGGRLSGIPAQLASTLANLVSVDDMMRIARQPAATRLAAAERRRFDRVSSGVRVAGESLVCCSLPFSRGEAEATFPDHNVGAAIAELVDLGLLRGDDDQYEMHELVRSGLEASFASGVRTAAHDRLAARAHERGRVGAEIHHLLRAGREQAAHIRAREEFLQGKSWDAVGRFVLANRLVTAEEVVTAFAHAPAEGAWRLTEFLTELADASVVPRLLVQASAGGLAYLGGSRHGRPIAEAILKLAPERFCDLLALILTAPGDATARESALVYVVLAKRQSGPQLAADDLRFILSRPSDERAALVDFLWMDGRREALAEALRIEADLPTGRNGRHRLLRPLRLDSAEAVVELLAALPNPDPGLMLARRSALLQPHAELLWALRSTLGEHLPQFCTDAGVADVIRAQALRVLVFLGHPRLGDLVLRLMDGAGMAANVASVAPAIAPGHFDRASLEARLENDAIDPLSRLLAAKVLMILGARAPDLRPKLQKAGPLPDALWDLLFERFHPDDAADPVVLGDLALRADAATDETVGRLVGPVASLAEAQGEGVTELLLRLSASRRRELRLTAASVLARRRDPAALEGLKRQLAVEAEPAIQAVLASAIAASGAISAADIRPPTDTDAVTYWRTAVAMRAADTAAAGDLVAIALNARAPWTLRRAAIRAAGRLPYTAALGRIARTILAMPIPLAFDDDNMRAHQALGALLRHGVLSVLDAPLSSRSMREFVARCLSDLDPELRATLCAPAVNWLAQRLGSVAWPYRSSDAMVAFEDLQAPLLQSAVLRALARCGEPGPIEALLLRTRMHWVARKCVIMRCKIGPVGPALAERVRDLIGRSRLRGDPILDRIVEEMTPAARDLPAAPGASPEPSADLHVLSRSDVEAALQGASDDLPKNKTLRVDGLDAATWTQLAAKVDPILDRERGEITYQPDLALTASGEGIVGYATRFAARGPMGAGLRDRLRPALAAANVWRLPMPWHDALLDGAHPETYTRAWLKSLVAQGDASRFYAELDRREPLLIAHLCRRWEASTVSPFLDERFIPALRRYLSAGDVEVFNGLCALAAQIDHPEIEPVLTNLFARWLDYFGEGSDPAITHGFEVWQAFTALAGHPRFDAIPGWRARLEPFLGRELPYYNVEEVVRTLARDARSYVAIESHFAKSSDWMDFARDRIDELDGIAEALWRDCPSRPVGA